MEHRNMIRFLSVFLLAALMPLFSYADDTVPANVKRAADVIASDFGDQVSVTKKKKDLLKFGRNSLVGTTAATVMTLPVGEVHETYVTTDIINKFSSDDANDDGLVIQYEGHLCENGVPTTFVVDTATIDSTNETDLDTDVCRITRAFNASATELQGNIYFYEDDTVSAGVPQTATKIHLTIPSGKQQSVKASTALSSQDYAICPQVYGSILEKQSAFADFEIQVRRPGGVFREQFQFAVSSLGGASRTVNLDPPLIIPKSSDVRLVAAADGASTPVSGGFNCYLAIIEE